MIQNITYMHINANFIGINRYKWAGERGGWKLPLNLNLPKGRFQKKIKKMIGLIHPSWLAGVSLGPKSNQNKNVLKKKIQK